MNSLSRVGNLLMLGSKGAKGDKVFDIRAKRGIVPFQCSNVAFTNSSHLIMRGGKIHDLCGVEAKCSMFSMSASVAVSPFLRSQLA